MASLLERLDACGGGQIVGPHGSGKSTLLDALADALLQRGDTVVRWTINGKRLRHAMPQTHGGYLLIDGYEQLGILSSQHVRWRCWLRQTKLVVTTHQRRRLPVLATLAPSEDAIRSLFRQLTKTRRTLVTESDAVASYRRHNGNVREVWFDLYDRHERLARRLTGRRTPRGTAT
ncbi:MAG: hypothetical protein AAF589_08275 [Planctomycetota bacterium]